MKKFLVYGSLTVLIIVALAFAGEVINDYKNRKWDGINRFTMVVLDRVKQSAQILSIDPETKQPVRINLPGDMEIKTVSGRGLWKIKSVVALSAKYGPEWAADSFTVFLGIPYTAVREKIGIWDKIAWWNLTRGAVWKDINLTGTALVAETYAPDGDKVLSLTSWWQDEAGDIFYSSNLSREELQVAVYNTTDVTGLASKAADILENAGVKVTMTDQSDIKIDKCLVSSLPETENDPGIKWIVKYFKCDWQGKTGLDIKEVKVYFGLNFAELVNGGGQ